MSVGEECGEAADASTQVRYLAEPCMQCENPPCITAATNGAAYKRPDGIVIIVSEEERPEANR
jgi:Fe-S-cluster-containing dehydrogenase component